MITIETLTTQLSGPLQQDLERWIMKDWIRPDGADGDWRFGRIDVARAQLIWELRSDMQVNEEALPIVLSLLDQLYDLRRQMRVISEAFAEAIPAAPRIGHDRAF
jgi:chaperone modulatory protein CbpM